MTLYLRMMMMVLLVLIVVSSMMNTARKVGQGVAVVVVMVVGRRRILTLGARTVLTRGSRSRASTHHSISGSCSVHGVILLSSVHQITKQVVIREVSVLDQTLEVQRYLLSGELCQLSVRLFSEVFDPERRIGHVVVGG